MLVFFQGIQAKGKGIGKIFLLALTLRLRREKSCYLFFCMLVSFPRDTGLLKSSWFFKDHKKHRIPPLKKPVKGYGIQRRDTTGKGNAAYCSYPFAANQRFEKRSMRSCLPHGFFLRVSFLSFRVKVTMQAVRA